MIENAPHYSANLGLVISDSLASGERVATGRRGDCRGHFWFTNPRQLQKANLPWLPVQKFSGDYTGGATPVPIPNTEVKPSRAHGTARATARESRSSPGLKNQTPLSRRGLAFTLEQGHCSCRPVRRSPWAQADRRRDPSPKGLKAKSFQSLAFEPSQKAVRRLTDGLFDFRSRARVLSR